MTSAASIPSIKTAELPMPDNRDQAWRIMGECPIVAVEDGYAVTSRRLAEQVLKNPEVFSSKKAFDALGSPVPLVPVATDPPEQTRYRQILQPFFSPRVIKPLEPQLRAQVVELIEPIAVRGSCEFIAEVASVFPTQVFLTLFGLPLDMRNQLIDWKDALLGATDATASSTQLDEGAQASLQKAAELYMYLVELVQKRRGQPGDDVLSEILNLPPEAGLADDEAVGLCFLFILAGLDTVTDALGFGMQRLATNPSLQQQIVDDPALIPAATEELVRLDPPAPFLPRVTTQDTTIDGLACPAGTKITGYLATANRDAEAFPDPYAVDFHRATNQHFSFGVGPHRCLGSHLARLEMNIFYEEWHKRIPEYHITPGTHAHVHWPRGTVGLDELHLTIR